MNRKTLIFSIFSTFILNTAPEIGVITTFAKEIRLNGIIISTNGRSALVNGKRVLEGDRVGGVRVLAIDEHSIRVQSGDGQRELRVGASADLAPAAAVARGPAQKPQKLAEDRSGQRRVERGDTLSQIAQDYVGPEVTLNQIMLAIFSANPEAFGNNINRLYAGAVLTIPAGRDLGRIERAAARAEVARQTIRWRGGTQAVAAVSKGQAGGATRASPVTEYGPVAPGETLSEIAAELAPGIATPSRMMIALFALNPDAFGNGMDVLRAGTTLRVPTKEQALLAFSARIGER